MIEISQLDDVLYNLYMCENCLKSWNDTDELLLMFNEASDDDQTDLQINNGRVKEQSSGFIMKAIKALKSMIEKLIITIKNTIGKLFMSKEEKEAFAAFKAEMAKNPQYANKTFSLKDFRNYQAQYDDLMTRSDKADSLLASGQDCDLSKLFGDCEGFLKNTGNLVATSVGMRVLENFAYSNQAFAIKVSKQLEHDKKLLAQLENSVGKKATKKFQKDMNALSKRTLLIRMKYKLNHQMYGSLVDTIQGTMGEVKHEMQLLQNITTSHGIDKTAGVLSLAKSQNARRIFTAGIKNDDIKSGAKTLLSGYNQINDIRSTVAGVDNRSTLKRRVDQAKRDIKNDWNKFTGKRPKEKYPNYTNNDNINSAINNVSKLSSFTNIL